MHKIDRNEDIRWYKSSDADNDTRCTYIETLYAEIQHGNSWIYPHEWDTIKKLLPGITEDEAKEQCFIIKEKIIDRVDYHRHQYG